MSKVVEQSAVTRVKPSASRYRILFVAHTAELGGPSHSLLLLVKYLTERFEIRVLLPEHGPLSEQLKHDGVRHFTIAGLTWQTIPKMCRLIRRERINLIYGNNPSNSSRNALIAAKATGRPFVWHFRGMKQHWGWRKGVFVRWADEVVAVSRACAEPLDRFRSGRTVKVVYNGVEPTYATWSDDQARAYVDKQLGLGPGSRYLISVSHLAPRKGHNRALEVMQVISQRRSDVHLLVAGSLERDRRFVLRLRGMIQELGLGDRVHLLGFRKDVNRLLGGSDAMLHTAERDPHPRSVIEAMAAGIPVVAFGIDGVAETVVDGETGRLLDLGDHTGMAEAIEQVLDAPGIARLMGSNGRARMERHFTAKATASRVEEIMEGQLGSQSVNAVPNALGGVPRL